MAASYAPLMSKLHQLFPQLGDVAVDYRWSGHVALTMDHIPHLHKPDVGVIAAIGCNGRGVGMATSTGKVVAETNWRCSGRRFAYPCDEHSNNSIPQLQATGNGGRCVVEGA